MAMDNNGCVNFQFSASGGGSYYSYGFQPFYRLPIGITIDSRTGVVSGCVTGDVSEDGYEFGVCVRDKFGGLDCKAFDVVPGRDVLVTIDSGTTDPGIIDTIPTEDVQEWEGTVSVSMHTKRTGINDNANGVGTTVEAEDYTADGSFSFTV